MHRPGAIAATLSGCLLASACASFDSLRSAPDPQQVRWSDIERAHGATLAANGPSAAPPGLLEFCARMPAACHSEAPAPTLGALGFGAAKFMEISSPLPPQGPIVGDATPELVFARLLEMRVHALTNAAPRSEAPLTNAAPRSEAPLNERRWLELAEVNTEVNEAIVATPDARRYGVGEYWAMPIIEAESADLAPEGDCEDYALEKRARLLALGWERSALTLAVAQAPRVGVHAVLVVQTDRGDFVLDNFYRDPQPIERLNYRWISRQSTRSMTEWASARVEPSPYVATQHVLEATLRVDLLGPRTGGVGDW